MALDAVIFDLDGTLLDTNEQHARSWAQTLEAFGHTVGQDRVALEIGKGGDLLMASILGEGLAEREGDELSEARGERFEAMIAREGVRIFPGVRELFDAIHARGLRVAVATASKKEKLKKMLEEAGLDLFSLVDVVVTDTDVEESKPAPDTVTAAVKKLKLSPAQCIMVGDTPYDMQSARRAGVLGLAVNTGVHGAESLRGAGARAVYADVADLLDQLDAALAAASPGAAHLTQDRLEALMRDALKEAEQGMAQGEVPIGSVIARGDGTVIARGHNEAGARRSRTAHAEMRAFDALAGHADRDDDGLILVTTLEPCVMCLGAAFVARVDTILYAHEAPDNGGTERCVPTLEPGARMPRLVPYVLRAESRALLRQWLDQHPDDAFVANLLANTDEKR